MKKLEEQLSDTSRRGDDLQRALTELSVAKNRLTGRVDLKLGRPPVSPISPHLVVVSMLCFLLKMCEKF